MAFKSAKQRAYVMAHERQRGGAAPQIGVSFEPQVQPDKIVAVHVAPRHRLVRAVMMHRARPAALLMEKF